MAESKEELKSLLMRVEEESEKRAWNTTLKKTKVVASGPITSWQKEGQNVEAVTDFIFLGSKITAGVTEAIKLKDACSLEPMPNLDSILKSFANKGLYGPSCGFSSSRIRMWELNHKEVLSPKELMLSNYGAGEDSWEFLGLQGDQTRQS